MSPAELWRRLHYLLNRSRIDAELREEMATHRAMKQPGERSFGNPAARLDDARDVWGWRWLDHLRQDVRFAVRTLRRAPVFASCAIAILAVGIGPSLAAFHLLNALAFVPLPVPDPDRLVRFHRRTPQSTTTSFSYPTFEFYATHNSVLSASMAVVHGWVTLDDKEAGPRARVLFVSSNYLAELGARPAAGRIFQPGIDDRMDAPPVIVLSWTAWQRRFAGDPAIVGRVVHVNDAPFTVAAVTAEGFNGLGDWDTAAWVPITQHRVVFPGSDLLTAADQSEVRFLGRLKAGTSRVAAEDALRATVAALREQRPDAARDGEWLATLPAGYAIDLDDNTLLAVAIGGTLVGLVLVAACVNLGTLILARGLAREQEIAIRLSVGASRGRLIRQLLTESAVLAAAGTAMGLLVSFVLMRLFMSMAGASGTLAPPLNAPLLLAGFAVASVSALVVGLLPALQAVRPRGPRLRARNVLVAAQVTAGCALLAVSGLLLRGVHRATSAPLGFEFRQHVTVDPGLTAHGIKAGDARAYWERAREAIGRTPGVTDIALASLAPLGNRVWVHQSRDGMLRYHHRVEPAYFRTLGIRLLAGRVFHPGERGAAVVGRALAERTWPGEDPLGRTIAEHTVVGVVTDARTLAVGNPAASDMYVPIPDEDLPSAVMIVRVAGDPAAAIGPLTRAVRAVDPRVSPALETLTGALEKKLDASRQLSRVVGVLGTIALWLAAIGIAGLVAYTVTLRRREIGIRLAIGAGRRHVVRAVVGQFGVPLATGLVLGFAIAWGVAQVLRGELFGLGALDPISYGGAAALFVLVAGLAALGPVGRALRIDPVTTLRAE